MREIKFRGKISHTDVWEHGDLVHDNIGNVYVYSIDAKRLYRENRVKPETVGQYTGLKDKNGKEIYEGDIYRFETTNMPIYNECTWCYGGNFRGFDFSAFRIDNDVLFEIEVVGNRWDNPELLDEL